MQSVGPELLASVEDKLEWLISQIRADEERYPLRRVDQDLWTEDSTSTPEPDDFAGGHDNPSTSD